ncbi:MULTISPECIES: hypothetical protein [Streptomyces]|uniref:Uncharacterized protein n=1 Tax=Streptomyces venezuelae (strain ATCC 10712 / CBS 650.69 / DSM 40230 / JCM 4526 / NBRC 13096 / PD 04745) TaxID=953739 RepID=F2RLX3_STRVP|nr:hypothetical protein [Streptomyces venezuelae]APE25816.1 hypothetical protein vnz_35570 [Streptomyces venezuelae]QES03152.1 hypothetical protein DEJ43_36145 [Streptomyces venezuelae ATCC 10712]CCA60503.1 hypothetical protein SVEN_7217 [Streptomyces venezuelae ATCC 10712]
MTERYVPQFSHKDWIDNQDRVQAGGENGLNSRFHQLEAEFLGLAENQINPMLDVLGTPTRHLTLVPALHSYAKDGIAVPGWEQAVDMVAKPANVAEAHGFMNIVLPDGVQVRSLLVTGSNQSSTGTLTVSLDGREIGNNDAGTKRFVSSTKLGIPAPPAEEVRIKNESIRYYLTVEVVGAELTKPVKVFCVQLVYQ